MWVACHAFLTLQIVNWPFKEERFRFHIETLKVTFKEGLKYHPVGSAGDEQVWHLVSNFLELFFEIQKLIIQAAYNDRLQDSPF